MLIINLSTTSVPTMLNKCKWVLSSDKCPNFTRAVIHSLQRLVSLLRQQLVLPLEEAYLAEISSLEV